MDKPDSASNSHLSPIPIRSSPLRPASTQAVYIEDDSPTETGVDSGDEADHAVAGEIQARYPTRERRPRRRSTEEPVTQAIVKKVKSKDLGVKSKSGSANRGKSRSITRSVSRSISTRSKSRSRPISTTSVASIEPEKAQSGNDAGSKTLPNAMDIIIRIDALFKGTDLTYKRFMTSTVALLRPTVYGFIDDAIASFSTQQDSQLGPVNVTASLLSRRPGRSRPESAEAIAPFEFDWISGGETSYGIAQAWFEAQYLQGKEELEMTIKLLSAPRISPLSLTPATQRRSRVAKSSTARQQRALDVQDPLRPGSTSKISGEIRTRWRCKVKSCLNYPHCCWIRETSNAEIARNHYPISSNTLALWIKRVKAGQCRVDKPDIEIVIRIIEEHRPAKPNPSSATLSPAYQWPHPSMMPPGASQPWYSTQALPLVSQPDIVSSPYGTDMPASEQLERFFRWLVKRKDFKGDYEKLMMAKSYLLDNDYNVDTLKNVRLELWEREKLTPGLLERLKAAIRPFKGSISRTPLPESDGSLDPRLF